MNCARCGLPIDDEHPFGEYVAHNEYHDILTCVEALKAALAEAQKPSVAAVLGYEAGVAETEAQIECYRLRADNLEAELARLRDQTTPRRFSERTPDEYEKYFLGTGGKPRWVGTEWDSFVDSAKQMEEWGYFFWLPMPPAPEVKA